MNSLLVDREKVHPFEALTKELFLEWYPGQVDKWQAFQKIRHDWISRYGQLKGYQYNHQGKRISFLGKLKWAFRFIDELNRRRKK